jgi:hypothetical protein
MGIIYKSSEESAENLMLYIILRRPRKMSLVYYTKPNSEDNSEVSSEDLSENKNIFE